VLFSDQQRSAEIAHQAIRNQQVAGSIPAGGSKTFINLRVIEPEQIVVLQDWLGIIRLSGPKRHACYSGSLRRHSDMAVPFQQVLI
jgi:hypothetical protein